MFEGQPASGNRASGNRASAPSQRTQQYLKKAAGQVVLVVVSVLIALQIAEWTENLEADRRYHTQLTRLADDLRADTSFYQSIVMRRLPSKIEGLRVAKAWIQGDVTVKDTLDFLNTVQRGAIFGTGIFPVANFTYREMASTGEVSRIRNAPLRVNLHRYYREMEVMERRAQRQSSDYIQFVNGYATFDYSRPLQIESYDRERMMQAMTSDRFTTLVNLEYTYAQAIEQEMIDLRNLALKLLQTIEKEIEKR